MLGSGGTLRWLLLFPFATILLAGASCAPPRDTTPSSDRRMVEDLKGWFSVDPATGLLKLELNKQSCVELGDGRGVEGGRRTAAGGCIAFENDGWRTVHVLAPWGQRFLGALGGPSWVAFKVDWSKTGVDPFGIDGGKLLARPWRVESPHAFYPTFWDPKARDLDIMLALIGDATDTQITVGEVAAPASLAVTELRLDGGVRNGAPTELVVSVTNTGGGDAYRLLGTTRSNIPALHGLRLGFGRIAPGASKTRRVRVTLPRENDEVDALVVVSFAEAHQFAPAPATIRVPIQPALDLPALSLVCHVIGATSARVTVDALQVVSFECVVKNTRAAARRVRVAAMITGGTAVAARGEPFDLPASGEKTVALSVEVPHGAAMDSELTVTVTAKEESGAQAETSFKVVVARPNICAGGKLTRAKFLEKRAELRRALDAGLLSRQEYEMYEAELVGCLAAD